jgi:2-desacetyl-2-hydroxyethyl bacteriochlorophyllide A dehydrogenase
MAPAVSIHTRYINFPAKGVVDVREENVALTDLRPAEVVIRSEASVISAGTELARLHDIEKNATFPARPGYGTIGRVLAKGETVNDVKVGSRVFFAGRHAGVQRFLHLQDHQWGYLYPCPEGIPAPDAAMVCMAEIAMTAANITQLSLNDTVAVFGLGLVGNLAAQFYRLAGARVVGVDPVPERGAAARQCGIEHIIAAPPAEQVKALQDFTNGKGADVTVDAVGHSAVIQTAVNATAKYGQVLLLGSPRAPFSTDITPIMSAIHSKGIVVRGAHMWRFPHKEATNVHQTVEWGYRTCFDLVKSGKLRVRELISHIVKPDEVPAAYEGLERRKNEYTGVVIDWSAEN